MWFFHVSLGLMLLFYVLKRRYGDYKLFLTV